MNIFPKDSIPAKIEEYGSARLGTEKNIEPYILVVGGSGSGKTRFFVKPNIMPMNSRTKEREHQK